VASPLTAVLVQQRRFVSELLELRGMIEPPLAARAANHATAEDIAKLEDILRRQKEKVSRGELAIEEDSEFHYTIARASNNKVVLQVVDVFMDLLRESRKQSLQVAGRLRKSVVSHQQILKAIARHDAEAAENAMRRHIHEVEAIVLQEL
jgi:GntR family transcriptional repressor for pyruvate dehydrogenase complex